MGITRPTGEQLRFRSQNTGDHVLDTYLEASEKGGRALTDLLDDLFDSSGTFRAANFEFQFDPSVDKIQFRAGNFANPSAGWTDITTFFNITGTFNAATTYQNFDLATTSDKDVYIVHGLSSGTTFANEAAFIASSNTTRIVDVSEARDWAKKTDGIVSSTDYSSKAWAIGGTGVTNSATGGAAKEWAIKTSGTVDGTNYSAKYWATSTDVVTVSTNIADVTTVATDISNVNTVSTNISSVNTTSSNIADVNTVAAEIGVGQDVTVVAADLSGTDTIGTAATNIANINTTAGSIANVNTVATSITNVNTVSGSIANVNTTATNIADVNTVAAQITNNNLQTIANDIAAVITTANDLNEAVSEIDTVANSIANVDTVGTNITSVNTVSTNIANVNTTATDISNVNTVAANLGAGNDVTVVAANIADVNTVAGISADVTTAATNSVQFNNTYLGAASTAPTLDPDGSALDLGDLYFDTTTNTMKVYSASGWINAGSSVNGTADRFTYTATASQTTFTGSDDNTNSLSYDAGFIDVYMNGVKLVSGSDFTATNGTSVVLASAAAANDTIEIIAYGTFTLSNQSINDMTDVSTSGVADNNLLAYNSANSQFEPIQDPDVRFVTAEQINLRNSVNTGKVLVLDVEQGDVIGVGDLEIYDDRTTGNGYIKRGDTSVQTIAADTVSITDHTAQNQRAYFNASGLTVSGTVTADGSLNISANNPRLRFDDDDTSNNGEITLDNTALRIEVDEDNLVANSVLKFRVDGDNKATIDSDGHLGLGTENPYKMLHLSGGNALLQNANSETALAIVANANVTDAGNKIAFFGASRYTANEEMASIKGLLKNNSGGPGNVQLGHLAFSTSGVEKMRIQDGGNIGFGVQNPLAFLHAQNSGNVNIRFETTTADTVQTQYKTSAQQWSVGTDNANQFFVYDSNNAHSAFTLTPLSEAVFNQNSKDMDFRVESDTNSSALFVDAGTNTVNMGTSVAATAGAFAAPPLYLKGNVTGTFSLLHLEASVDTSVLGIGYDGTNSQFVINSSYRQSPGGFRDLIFQNKNGTDHVLTVPIGDGTSLVVNDASLDHDFRIESNNNANCFILDANNDEIYLAKNSSSGTALGGIIHAKSNRFYQFLTETTTNAEDAIMYLNRQSSDGKAIYFRRANSSVGNISLTTSGTTYTTTSDRRLKTDIEPIADATDKLMAMNPVTHRWKLDPDGDAVHGFIAQEMQEIVPEAVSGDPDGEEMMSMDYGRITPVLVAALQDAHKKIEALEERLAELEAK